MQSAVALTPNFAAAPKRLSPLAAAAATLSIPAAPGQFRLCFSVEVSWGSGGPGGWEAESSLGSDGSGQAEIQGAQDGRYWEEGGCCCCPRTSQRRSCNCAEENSCDPATESEKESGSYHP